LVVTCCRPAPEAVPQLEDLVERLSEPGGYFDTDNLISNETAYTQVVHALEPMGGVYIGVGPEQNFQYIGRIRPSWAFILDVRRDNMLHHLLLNTALIESETPYEYLCFLFSRRCEESPDDDDWDGLIEAFDRTKPNAEIFSENLIKILDRIKGPLHFDLDSEQRDVVEFIYRSYFEGQLGLRFHSYGRPPMPYHPSYRTLLLAEGPDGQPSDFLSRRGDYNHVRGLALRGRLVPVVGDFAGKHALRAIGRFVRERGETVSAFYLSNVEFYLIRNGVYSDFVENVRSLPITESSLLIRAYFSYGYPHPEALPGHRSTLVRQKARRFLELYDQGAYRSYWDVSTLDYEP
jgi:hypothetical protein